MVNSILKYIEPQLKAYMQFLNRVDSPVFRISNGEMIKGNGQEKEVVSISDLNGNSLYIRQTQPETINERKALSSCDKEYNISARCKLVFYTFGGNDFTINPDKVKSKIINTLASLDFSHYSGSSTEIKIDVNGTSLDIEKIYTEETGKEFTGNVWPTLVSVDFILSYVDTNCNTCDIDDSETVVTWTPDLTPENCETKAICEVISKCDVITLLQEQTASLQEQIDNLPQSGLTCTDLPNCQTIIDILQSINDIVSGLPSSYFSCGDLAVCQTIIDIVSDISDLQTQVGTNTTDISTLQGQVSSLISDLGTLTTTVNNHISDTSNPHNVTLEQARSENSSISGDINANNNTIINLKDAVNPQEPITKIQFDTYVSAVGGNRGAIDCSANPNYPASNKGDRWEVTVAGKIGGPSGINVDVYDEIVCVTASASGDQATVGVNFYIVQGNIERATETTNGYTSYATDAETQSGTNNTKTITPLKLYNWFVALVQSVFVKKGTLTTNYIPKATASDTIGDSNIIDDGTNVGIGLISPTSKVHIHGADSTSSNYALKVDNSASMPLWYVRNDGYLFSQNAHGNGVSTFQIYNTGTGVGFDFKGYYGRLSLGAVNTSVNATLSLTDYGTVQNFINFDSDGLKGDIHGLGGGITFIGKQNGSPRFQISSDDGFLANNGYRTWFKGRMVIADSPFSTTAQLHIQGIDSTSSNYALKVDNLASSPLLYVRNDGNVGISTASPIAKLDVNGSIRSENLTASQIVATDASKNLQSLDVATYPSLTELTYVKGATSALQTQLDGKVNIADRKGADTYLKTGSTTFDLRYSTNATAFTPTTSPVGKNAMAAMPFIIEETMTFDRIGAEVTTSVVSGVCSLLIYDSVNNVPTNLVLDAGTISVTSATYQEITINKQLAAGLYYLVLWHNGSTTPTFRGMPIAACNKVLGMPSTLGIVSTYTRIYNTKVYTTAPSIYDTTGITVYASNNPIISLRRSA